VNMDKKLLIFLVGFFALYFAYQKFFLEPMVKARKPVPTTTSSPTSPSQSSESAAASAPVARPAANPVPAEQPPAQQKLEQPAANSVSESHERKAVVDTPLYRAEFTNRGAVLTSFKLKRHLDDFNEPLEMVPQEKGRDFQPLGLDFDNKELTTAAANGIFTLNSEKISVNGSDTAFLEFSFSDGRNTFRKKITFRGDSYLLTFEAEARTGDAVVPTRVVWSPGVEAFENYKEPVSLQPTQAVLNTGEKIERKAAKKIEQFQKVGATVKWAGLENNYFAAIFIPKHPADAYLRPSSNTDERKVHDLTLELTTQQPGIQEMTVFVGPKDYSLLKDLGMDLEKAVDFGFWGPIAKGLFIGLQWLHGYTGNYGWAIVILTFLIKLIFTPFMQKSFASQKKMQAMQPEMKQIQDKYAKMKNDDPRKAQMNTEIMALHKRHGINPLGGCLPMLVQMPVLIGFYRLLSNAISLRHAPFMLWITDLSKPDPWHVMPLVMGGSMLVQQRMTPISDPMQKNMMYIMPVMFTFMSFKLQSGLVLYWLLSNILGILHQWLFQQQQKRSSAAVAVREGNA
jgi:YidC/Oxa1 family membrane protein insertase